MKAQQATQKTFEEAAKAYIEAHPDNYGTAEGGISAAVLRDRFSTSRKYAVSLLEYLDSLGITRREGDSRTRGPNAPSSN